MGKKRRSMKWRRRRVEEEDRKRDRERQMGDRVKRTFAERQR